MSAKKKEASGRPSVGGKAEESSVTQSAAERRVAEDFLRSLVDKFAPTHLRLMNAVRKGLQERLPTACEVVYEYRDFLVVSYSPTEKGYDGVLGVRASADGVKLYFNGAKELPDPEKRLKGSGSQARWIDLDGASDLAEAPVQSLIDEAIARSRVPFASAGSGSIVVSPSSVKKVPKSNTSKKKD